MHAPPQGPNSYNFMQFLGKFGKIVGWRPPWRVGAPSSGKSWIPHCIDLGLQSSDLCGEGGKMKVFILSIIVQLWVPIGGKTMGFVIP